MDRENLDVEELVDIEVRELNVAVVDVDRKTPVEYVKDVLLVEFLRQDAGMVKQHGRPLDEVVLG